MTSVSGETKNSATGLMNIVGMLPYPVEQSFCKSCKDCAKSSSEAVCYWNPLFFP